MRRHRLAAALVAALVLAPLPGHGQDEWQASFASAAGDASRTPVAPLRIELPAGTDTQVRARLSLEVDAIDVTALAQISDTAIIYTPLQPLAPGRHQARLVDYDDNGVAHEHGSWTFTVAEAVAAAPAVAAAASGQAARPRSTTELHADLSLGGAERLADHGLADPRPARFSSEGSGSFGMSTKGGRWSTVAEVDLTEAGPAATADAVNAGAGDASGVQLAQFRVGAQSEAAHLLLGDQSLPYNGLAVSQLNRRGVSGEVKLDRLRATVGAFSVRSDVISGFAHGLGVRDPDHRVSGVVLGVHPLVNAEALNLVVAWAGGRGAPDGTGVYLSPLQVTPSGNSLGLDVDSQLLDRRLHMHAAFARSVYDIGVPGLPRHADHASNFLLAFQPVMAQGAGAVSAQSTLSYQSTGTYFRSLANPGIAPDLRQWQFAQSLNGSIWSVQGSFALDADNADRNPALATLYTRRVQVSTGLFPASGSGPGKFAAWLGTPYYSLGFDGSHSRNGTLPNAALSPTDLDISNLNLSAQFSHPRWNWNVGLMSGHTTDRTRQQASNRVFGPTLGANVTLGESGSLGFAAQFSDTEDKSTGVHAHDGSYNVYASGDLMRGKLTGQLQFSITRTAQAVSQFIGTPQPGASYNTRTLGGSLLWHAVAARSNHPGLDLSLAGLWNHGGYPALGGMPALPSDTWQVFLKASVVLPLRYPGVSP